MEFHYWIILFLSIACYYNSLHCDFVFDDIAAIKENRDIRPHTPFLNIFYHDFWGTSLTKEQSHKSYRPLTVLTYRFNYWVHGLRPFGYHLVNVVLHAVVCIGFFRFCNLFIPFKTSFISSVLFAVHPIHTEAVASIVGRTELLSAIFYLAALSLYITKRQNKNVDWLVWFGVPAFAVLGLLCKEQCVSVLAVCCTYEITSIRPSMLKFIIDTHCKMADNFKVSVYRVAVLFLTFGTILWFRILIMGSYFPKFNRFDNPASVSKSPHRQLTYNYLSAVNFGLLFYPSSLCCDWSMDTIPLVTSFSDIRNIATAATYLGLLAVVISTLRRKKLRQSLLMGIAMMVIPYIPVSNLFFPVGFVIAERTLYLPSMGFCILFGIGWTQLSQYGHQKMYIRFNFWLLVLIFAVRTIKRNDDWQTEFSLYNSGLRVNQNNAKLYNNMGRVLERESKYTEALNYYKSAIRIQSDDVRGYLNYGKLLVQMGNYEEAENVYLQAKSLFRKHINSDQKTVTKSHLQIFFHLASLIAHNDSRLQEADDLYQQVIDIKDDFADAYLNRGNVLMKMNRTEEAKEMYARALELDTENPDVYSNLAVAFMERGQKKEALSLFNQALAIQPDHEKALINSAILMQETDSENERHLAAKRLQILLDKNENEDLYFDLGMTFLSKKDFKNAEILFKKAIQKQPVMRSALYNLGLLLSNQHRSLDALIYVKQLLKFYPNHVNGLILLADIYINTVKDLDSAEQCYSQVLKLEPNNFQSLHNLCVIHVQRTEYQKAIECFDRVSNLFPKIDDVRQHLAITKQLLATSAAISER